MESCIEASQVSSEEAAHEFGMCPSRLNIARETLGHGNWMIGKRDRHAGVPFREPSG